jgi:hypothetical protein
MIRLFKSFTYQTISYTLFILLFCFTAIFKISFIFKNLITQPAYKKQNIQKHNLAKAT